MGLKGEGLGGPEGGRGWVALKGGGAGRSESLWCWLIASWQ